MTPSEERVSFIEWLDILSHRYLPRWLAQRLCPWATPKDVKE